MLGRFYANDKYALEHNMRLRRQSVKTYMDSLPSPVSVPSMIRVSAHRPVIEACDISHTLCSPYPLEARASVATLVGKWASMCDEDILHRW